MYQCQPAEKHFTLLQPTTPSFRPLWQSHIEEVSACWQSSPSSAAGRFTGGRTHQQSRESGDASRRRAVGAAQPTVSLSGVQASGWSSTETARNMAANLMPGIPRTELIACAGFVYDRNAVAIPEALYCDAITFDTTVSSWTGEASPERTGNALNFGGTSRGWVRASALHSVRRKPLRKARDISVAVVPISPQIRSLVLIARKHIKA